MFKKMYYTALAAILQLGITQAGHAQAMPIDTAGFQVFTYQDGDTTYIMKQYFLCLLKTGLNRDQTPEVAAQLQEQHLAHLDALASQRKICLAGPLGDDTIIRGIVVYNTPTQAEAEQLAKQDPAVIAGRLTVEIHPWWAAIGAQLF